MTRILRVPITPLVAGPCRLTAEAAHYVTRVHRLQVGETFLAFDPEAATLALATIRKIERQGVECELAQPEPADQVVSPAVHLLQALGKSDKPDQIVRDATALGVRSIRFVHTTRTVVHLRERADSRLSRWRSIAIEAARQSKRPELPQLLAPLDLAAALRELPEGGLRLLLDPEAVEPLTQALQRSIPAAPVVLLLGPEGGLSGDECQLAAKHGFEGCSLGPYVLRSETAAIAALSVVIVSLHGATAANGPKVSLNSA